MTWGPPADLEPCELCRHVRGDHARYADDRYQTPCDVQGCMCGDFQDPDGPSLA